MWIRKILWLLFLIAFQTEGWGMPQIKEQVTSPPLEFPLIMESDLKNIRAVWSHPQSETRVFLGIQTFINTEPVDLPHLQETEIASLKAVWSHPEPDLRSLLEYFHCLRTQPLAEPRLVETNLDTDSQIDYPTPPIIAPLEIGRKLMVVKGVSRFIPVKKGYTKVLTKIINTSHSNFVTVKLSVLVKDWQDNRIISDETIFVDALAAGAESKISFLIQDDLSNINTVSISYAEGFLEDFLKDDQQSDFQKEIRFDHPK